MRATTFEQGHTLEDDRQQTAMWREVHLVRAAGAARPPGAAGAGLVDTVREPPVMGSRWTPGRRRASLPLSPALPTVMRVIDKVTASAGPCGYWLSRLLTSKGLPTSRAPYWFRPLLTRAQCTLHLILDNYATHKTPLIRRWLAKRTRFHRHFTPIRASWINLVERSQHGRPGRRDLEIQRAQQHASQALDVDQNRRRSPR